MLEPRRPAVIRAALSPVAIGLGGAVALAILLTGAGLAAGVVAAVLAWAAGVALKLSRRPGVERIDPFTVQDPWRTLVRHAQSSGRRFDEAVRQTRAGPLRDRLDDVGRRVHTAVGEAWAIAQRGHALDRAVAKLGLSDVRRRLAQAELANDPTAGSLRNQLDSAERLAAVAQDAEGRLRRLNAQLDEAVAQAIELSVSAGDVTAIQPLGSDVEHVVDELTSLRQALEEAG